MLDIGWPELMVVVIVLIVVVGPKDLPGMIRNFAKTTKKMRSMAGDFRSQFDDALKEADLGDVKDLVNTARDLNPATQFKSALDPLSKMGSDVKSDFNKILADAEPSVAAKSVAKKTEASKEAPAKKAPTEPKAATAKPAAKKAAAPKPAVKKPAAKKPAAKKTVAAKKPAAKAPKSDAS